MINFHIVINRDISVTVSGNVWKDHSRVICPHSVMFSQFLKDGQYLATGWNFFAGDRECGCVLISCTNSSAFLRSSLPILAVCNTNKTKVTILHKQQT